MSKSTLSYKGLASNIHEILLLLFKNKSFDLKGSNPDFLIRRIDRRLKTTNSPDYISYINYLKNNISEFDHLADALTINVSRFFRNAFTYNYISKIIIPKLIQEKIRTKTNDIRIWSAGCATGEEPYSIAMMIDKCLNDNNLSLNVNIFATDINEKSLDTAKKAEYIHEALIEMEFAYLSKYFSSQNGIVKVIPKIQEQVHFSSFDLLNKKNQAPEESIFGHFDIIFCRNVLIYFNKEYQHRILRKLQNTMHKSSYLILGENEDPMLNHSDLFRQNNDLFKIYQKNG
ncbi:CheR family methyltransferase [Ancylomarina sp. YFZ004]